jgi:hypothetical protein
MCRSRDELSAVKHLIIAALMLTHSWYPQECCHDNDCRPVPCTELSYRGKDVVWRKHIYFSGPMIRESKDGNCHVCVKEGLSASIIPYLPICVFVPHATS